MINYIETHLVDHCNLKCRGCSHFSGLAPEQYKSFNDFQAEMEQLSRVADVGIIRLMGGEPLLHPQVVEFCEITRSIFPKAEVVLVSNGILLSHLIDDDINRLNQSNIELCISNYGLKLNWNQINKFQRYYFHGKTQMYNISLDPSGSQDIVLSYLNCDLVQGKWLFFKDGRLYQCCIMANIDFFNQHFNEHIDIDINDISIDIFSHNEEEIQQFLNHPHKACKYCNTIKRHNSYANFATSKGDINEWISQS